MVNFPGRNDRRRRVLKEELLAASSSRVTLGVNADAESADGAPRYSDAAGVENHPQITDFVPRRYGTIAILTLGGAATTSVSAAIHYFVLPIAATRGMNIGRFRPERAGQSNIVAGRGRVVSCQHFLRDCVFDSPAPN